MALLDNRRTASFPSLIGNGILLLLFAKHAALSTLFTLYLINLLFANFLSGAVQLPLDFTTNLYNGLWLYGDEACTVYLYAHKIFRGSATSATVSLP